MPELHMVLRLLIIAVASTAILTADAASLAASQTTGLSLDQLVELRQTGFQMSVMTMTEMKLAGQQGADVRKQYYAASSLERWARAMPGLFPSGTNKGATAHDNHASIQIWQDRPGFERAATAYAADAAKLRDIARAGDANAFAEQLRAVGRDCDSCHYDYTAR
jgi:cytochrome c556